ncbi:hypothetical protein AC1031_014319 [Aphanomyces cochlioides]|nr:hypothetical protein AC1031_014319 [Aphanomyces cochlioides]
MQAESLVESMKMLRATMMTSSRLKIPSVVERTIDSGESDQSSDDEVGVYLIADDFPGDILGIQDKIVMYHKIPAAHGDSHRSKQNTAEEYRGSKGTDPCSDEVHEIHGDSSPTDECTTQAKVDSTNNTSDTIKVESISPISEVSTDGLARSVAGDAKQDSRLNDAAEPIDVPMSIYLTERTLEPALDAFDCAVEEAKGKFTKLALKWLENNAIFRVEGIEAGIVDSPVDGISRAEFVACVINRMKKDQRLEFVVSSHGSQAFLLSSIFEQSEENMSQNALDLALQEAVAKFTAIALKWLATDPRYHVADVKGQTKISPVQGVSKDDFVALIVDTMKQDKRLKFAIDPKGRPVFILSAEATAIASTNLEAAVQDSVDKFTAFALKHLVKHEFFHVANIEGQIKASPVTGISRDDFVARVVDCMKQDNRFKFDTDLKGRHVFTLASSMLTAHEPRSIPKTTKTEEDSAMLATSKASHHGASLAPTLDMETNTTKNLHKIELTPSRVALVKEVEAAQITLKALTQDESRVNQAEELFAPPESCCSLASPDESKDMRDKITAINVKNAVQAAAHKFTARALMWLETNPQYYIANIMSQTKTRPVDGLSRDEFVARIVVHMKQDTRLKYAKDAQGRPAFMLSKNKGSEYALKKSPIALEVPVHPDGRPAFTLSAQCSASDPERTMDDIDHDSTPSLDNENLFSLRNETSPLSSDATIVPDNLKPMVQICVAIVAIILDEHCYVQVSKIMKWIKKWMEMKNITVSLDEFLCFVADGVKSFAVLSTDKPLAFLKFAEFNPAYCQNTDSVAKQYAKQCIAKMDKKVEKACLKLRQACEEEKMDAMTSS